MALDAGGVTAALQGTCPLDGVAGPFSSSDANLYPDGNGAFWRLSFSSGSTPSQQQAAVNALSILTSYTPPQATGLTPYRISASATFGATLAVGTNTMPVAIIGLLHTDTPMIAWGTALPSGVEIRAQYPDPSQDGSLILQVAVLQVLTGSTTVPFTLIGVR